MISDHSRPLPRPGSGDLRSLVPDEETRAVYSVLYETRKAPLRMPEIREHVARRYGLRNEQMDRRLRSLRTHFVIPAEPDPSARNTYRYRLIGWRVDAESRSSRTALPASIEAAVFEAYGARCAWCGKTPKTHGVELVIDHKIPLDLGGGNELPNLQLLCRYHNHIKQARFAEYDGWTEALQKSISLPEPQLRIGELLKAVPGTPVPVDLINLVAREENRGDPTRRLRDLRTLGWVIVASRRRHSGRTVSYYTLERWLAWPQEGPQAAVARMERARRQAKSGR